MLKAVMHFDLPAASIGIVLLFAYPVQLATQNSL